MDITALYENPSRDMIYRTIRKLHSSNDVETDISNLLSLSVEYDYLDIVSTLLQIIDQKYRISTYIQSTSILTTTRSPLYIAVVYNRIEMVRILLPIFKKYIDVVYENGNTLLHMAVYNRYTEMVSLLLKNRIDIDAQSEYGNTALHIATFNRYRDISIILLRSGADRDIKNHNGYTFLDFKDIEF